MKAEKGKIIAVWGSPASGKSTFAVKLATAIYDNFESTVIVLFTDLETPMIPVIFPNDKPEDNGSVGVPLSKTDIEKEEIIKNLVTVKSRQNFGFIGYKDGENKFTYPRFGRAKAEELIARLSELADYVIVDCVSSLESNPLASTAVELADQIIRLASPDLRSISYYLSQLPLYVDSKYQSEKQIQGLNTPNADVFMPTEEAKSHLKDLAFTLPYSRQVKEQAQKGTLYEKTTDKKFQSRITEIARKVVEYGYTFKGWATSSSATLATYQAGGSYTANESVTLYAVWEINTYTVSFDANGGTNAPNPQKKTHGQNLILTVAIPTRPNHVFLGWATDSTSKSVAYAPGATYTAEEDVTLYAVWQERNYDFSVSDLTVTPDEIEQYGKVTVKFRVDNWDRNLPYANVPVEVLLNGTVIYSTTVNFSAYGVQNIVFGLNVGASLGTQTLVARINWADHGSETRTGNNSVSATFTVKKVVETSTSTVSVNGEYTEGSQVISSFYVSNEGSSDILPEDNVSFDFLVYALENGTVKVVSQQTWDKVVIPANGRNLVYFKWTVPANSAGTTYFCKGTITHENADKEQNSDNNTTEYAVVSTDYVSSQTPNTRFEKNAPAGYSPNATSPTAKAGSATWNMWVYEGGRLVLKSYGITVGNTTPTVTPGSGCLTAEKVGVTWKMKSGYGITLNWNPALIAKSSYIMPDTDAYTEAQSVYATFPEFGFSMANEKYRTLEKVGGIYQFIANPNADKNERVHFIPVYVANGSYTVSVTATQIWTPAGMITAVCNANTLTINGTIYDDYYVGN